MTFTILLALAAITISGVSAYFSIVGLAAIFAASVIPIIIMGTVIEYGKVISVAWIHWHWHEANKRIKVAMVSMIGIAMVLTSVGVFGFLSRAHVEQTAASDESIAQVQRIDTEVLRQKSIIARGENKIIELESTGSRTDDTIQEQIANEQQRINAAAERIQPAIDEQNAIIEGQTKLYRDQIADLDAELNQLKAYIDAGEIKKAQQMIGETSKGGWGPLTAETARLWRLERTEKKEALFAKIEDASQNNGAIIASRKEISRIRQAYEDQLAESNKLMNRLREKLGNAEVTNVDEQLDDQYERISNANKQIETLTNEKYTLEAEYRQLEAEVGPIKYIAEFVYGEEADASLLEKAVKMVIIMLLLVLDPFAVILVMAATDGYKWNRKQEEAAAAEPIDTTDLEGALAESEQQYNALMNTMAQRNKEMNELREETQEIIDEANTKIIEAEEMSEYKDLYPSLQQSFEELAEKLEETETVRDNLTQELANSERARDKLQLELDHPVIALSDEDAETIAELIEQRNGLQVEFEEQRSRANVLATEISKMEEESINIEAGEYDTIKLLQTNKELEDRISSMVKLSDFDITSAQALVESKNEINTLRGHLASVTSLYNELKENIEKGK